MRAASMRTCLNIAIAIVALALSSCRRFKEPAICMTKLVDGGTGYYSVPWCNDDPDPCQAFGRQDGIVANQVQDAGGSPMIGRYGCD